jgi:hypothetical protein
VVVPVVALNGWGLIETGFLRGTTGDNGQNAEHCSVAFTSSEIQTLEKFRPRLEGSTPAQKNPHHLSSLAWASWVIAKLGGWDGYRSSRPPGPITLRNGLQQFNAIAYGDASTNV